MLFRAIEFAAKAHAGQYRKGTGVPYVVHPLGVAKILIDHGCAEPVVVAGVLHDTIEDTPVTLQEVRRCFGEEVARLVEAVSEPDKSEAWEQRKRRTVAALRTAPLDVLLIECADKLDNVRAMRGDHARLGEALWARFNRPKESQQWYYRAVADALAWRMAGEPGATLFARLRAEVEALFGAPERPDR